jgi:hypothetical protein
MSWLRRWLNRGSCRRPLSPRQDLLDEAGIVDVTVLMGWFTGVSMTLMAFDVPSNATGLDQ